MSEMETETIDKLFLELSQVTTATTSKEKRLWRKVALLQQAVGLLHSMVSSGESHSEKSEAVIQQAKDYAP